MYLVILEFNLIAPLGVLWGSESNYAPAACEKQYAAMLVKAMCNLPCHSHPRDDSRDA